MDSVPNYVASACRYMVKQKPKLVADLLNMQVAKSESSQIARDPNEDDPEASDLIGFDAVKETECWRKI